MGGEVLSEEDRTALKQGLDRVRKAREERPVGFWYCQEAFDGLPRLLIAPAQKKTVSARLVAPLKRSAKKKGRICQGTAWRDRQTRQLRFAVIKGGFSDRQFKKDLKKLGLLAGVPVGRVSIGIIEDDRTRAALSRELLSEIDAENEALRQEAASLTGRDALDALAGILDLSEEERAEHYCGAGAVLYEQAQGRLERFADWILGRDDPDPEPTVADLWAFHQQSRAEHLEERAALSQTWAEGVRTTGELAARRDAALTPFSEACALVESAAAQQSAGTLQPRDALLAHRRLTTAWPPLFQQEQLVLLGLDGLERAGESLSGHLQGEIDFDRIRQQDLSPVPRHAATAGEWRRETEAALSAITAEIAAPRPARPDGASPRRAASLTEIALRLTWPPDALAAESALAAELEASAMDPLVGALREAETAVRELEAVFSAADTRRAACLRHLNDLRAAEADPADIAAAESALAAAESACAGMAGERAARLAALQEAESAAAALRDARGEKMAELIALRAEQKRAAARDAAARLDRIIAAHPDLAAADSALTAATEAERSARQGLAGHREALAALEAEQARLQADLAIDDRPAVYARSRQESIAADAALVRCQARLNELLLDLPDPIPDPLVGIIAEVQAEEAALSRAADEARRRRQDARTGARAAELAERVERLRAEQAQAEAVDAGLAADMARLSSDIAGLRALCETAPEARRPQLLARIEALESELEATEDARDRLADQREDRAGQIADSIERRDDFTAENADVLALAEQRQAERRRASAAALAGLEGSLAEVRARVESDTATLAAATEARRSAAEALGARVRAGPPRNLDRRMAHLEALEEQADIEEARQSTLSAQRLRQADQREVLAIKSEALARGEADRAALSVFSQLEDAFSLEQTDEEGVTLLERLREQHGEARIDAALAARDALAADLARLRELGEPVEDCLPLLASLPRAFWPDEAVAEARDYARISALLAEESAEQRAEREAAFRRRAVGTLADVGVEDALGIGMELSGLYLCDADAVATATGLDLDTTAGWKILSTVGVLASTSALVRSVLAKGATVPEGVSDVELRQLREELSQTGFEKARALLPGVQDLLESVDFALSCHKDSVLELIRSEALASYEGGPLLPGPAVVYGLIRSGIAVKQLLAAQEKLRDDEALLQEMREEGEEDLLVQAMENRAERSRRERTDSVVDATITGVNLVASTGSTLGGVGGTVAVGGWALASTAGAAKTAWDASVDWRQAAKLKTLLGDAVRGSRRAMLALFREHQKYATMLLLTRARDGNAAALRFCMSRGLHAGEVLDGAASLKLLREHLLSADGQSDDRGRTFSESCVAVWDAVAGMGRRVSELLSLTSEEERADLRDQRQDDLARERLAEEMLPDRRLLATGERLLADLTSRIRRREGVGVEPERAALGGLRESTVAARQQLAEAEGRQALLQRWKPTDAGAAKLAGVRALISDLDALLARIDAALA